MSECHELDNIKYKSMLLNSHNNKMSYSDSEESGKHADPLYVETMLQQEHEKNKAESWNKLDKTTKLKKLMEWSIIYSNEHGYTEVVTSQLKVFLKKCLDKGYLQKVKDVLYDKETVQIVDIPNLQYVNKMFTLKHTDRRVSTLKSLGAGKHKTLKKPT